MLSGLGQMSTSAAARAHRVAVVECRYDHSVGTTGLTDHSALTLTLDVTGAAV
jgi:hypothetical protein